MDLLTFPRDRVNYTSLTLRVGSHELKMVEMGSLYYRGCPRGKHSPMHSQIVLRSLFVRNPGMIFVGKDINDLPYADKIVQYTLT